MSPTAAMNVAATMTLTPGTVISRLTSGHDNASALRALDEQERQVGELRGRLPPVVAAGGIGATLLTRPVFGGHHPTGVVEIAATSVGLLGATVLVLAGAYLLRSRRLAFSVDARAALAAAEDLELLDDAERFHESMIATLTDRRAGNSEIVGRLHDALAIALAGLLLELVGLGVAAAVAS
jgi:hypothetical protein